MFVELPAGQVGQYGGGRRAHRQAPLVGYQIGQEIRQVFLKLEGLALEHCYYLFAADGVEEVDQVDVQQVGLAGVLPCICQHIPAVVIVEHAYDEAIGGARLFKLVHALQVVVEAAKYLFEFCPGGFDLPFAAVLFRYSEYSVGRLPGQQQQAALVCPQQAAQGADAADAAKYGFVVLVALARLLVHGYAIG